MVELTLPSREIQGRMGDADGVINVDNEENLMPVYSAVLVPIECENEIGPSNLSMECASAVEDHSLVVTDAETGPAVTIRETMGVINLDGEVSILLAVPSSPYCLTIILLISLFFSFKLTCILVVSLVFLSIEHQSYTAITLSTRIRLRNPIASKIDDIVR